jgi:hypothetical protein
VTRNVLFIGGPGSGKSNYLFRCWIAIERELGQLIKNGLPDDLDYLNAGAMELLEGRFAPHTSRDVSVTNRIPIALRRQPDNVGQLVVPDMSGEFWLDLYEKREWPTGWDELFTAATGFVLFIQAESTHNVAALDWLTCERYYQSGIRSQAQVETPTQVLLVEWLQIVRHEFSHLVGASYTPRLSVVVSAWDRITSGESSSPADYLALKFPMFSDYLSSKAHGFEAEIFGVSVASGDLDNDETFRDSYVAGNPATQGFAVSRKTRGRLRRQDVLAPIYWALNHSE